MSDKNILDHYGKLHSGFLHSYGEAATELLIEKLEVKPNETILEIGFGTGATLVKVASRFPDANYFGIELSEQMLAKARSRIKFSSLKTTIQLSKINSADELGVFKTKMDKVYIESVLGIQEDDELKKMIGKIWEQLKPKGKLIVNETIWKDDVPKTEIDRINKACKSAFGIIQSNGKYHTKQLWSKLVEDRGFAIRSMEEIKIDGILKERKNSSEWFSAIYTQLGKYKGKLNGKLRTEMRAYDQKMRTIIASNKQIMTGVIFVLEKN